MTGETLYARVVPIDPRDIFRGDYVTLGYDISTYTGTLLPDNENVLGTTVYVEPKVDDKKYIIGIENVSTEKKSETLQLQAKVQNIQTQVHYDIEVINKEGNTITLPYTETQYGEEFGVTRSFREGEDVSVLLFGTGQVSYVIKKETIESERMEKFDVNNEYLPGKILRRKADETVSMLDYGVDRFFVKENTGGIIEKAFREGKVYAEWRVSKSGNIVLSGLLVNNKLIR